MRLRNQAAFRETMAGPDFVDPVPMPMDGVSHDRSRSPRAFGGMAARLVLLAGVTAGSILALAFGRLLWGVHLAFESGALACFVALLWLERRRRVLSVGLVALLTTVLFGVALWFPPRESSDVWSYVMYGRIVRHGDDPYTTTPAHFPHDRWLRLVRKVWRKTPSLYGPLFNLTAGAVVGWSHGSALRARLGFQLLAALAVAGMMLLLWRRTRDPTALAFLGLNPLVVIGVVNGAHNDALVGLAVLAGALLAEEEWGVAAGVALGVGALIKVVALLPAGIVLAWLLWRKGFRRAAGSAAVACATVLFGYWAIGRGAAWRAIGAEAGLVTRFSVWRLVAVADPDTSLVHHAHIASGAAGWLLILVILALALIAAVPALRAGTPAAAVAAAGLVYLLAAPYVVPWYYMWILPVLALAWRSKTAWLAVAMQTALTVAYAMTLHKHFGPLGTTVRTVFFDVLAVADGVIVIWLAARGILRLRGGPALASRPTHPIRRDRTTAWPASSTFRPSVRRSGS